MEMWGLDLSIKELKKRKLESTTIWIVIIIQTMKKEEEEAEEEETKTTNSETEVIDGDEREVCADDIHKSDI